MPCLVSVIMPTYNCGQYISASVESIIHQTESNWELEIVDDCSTDNTFEVLEPYLKKYPHIHYCRLPHNSGPAAARTTAIKHASGKYCAFLDSDDLWMPDKLEKQIAFMEKNGAAFSCTAYKRMGADGNDLHMIIIPPKKTDYKKCLRLSNPIGNLTVMYDQEALGKFEVPMIKRRNDFALWLQILKKTQYCYGMEDVLGVYRTGHSENISSHKIFLAKYNWQLYRKIEGHNLVRSTFEMLCGVVAKGTGIGLARRRTDK